MRQRTDTLGIAVQNGCFKRCVEIGIYDISCKAAARSS
ncbi:hypothetical protein CAter282_2382 [Collimonas arenae]|uniref:Uncharacterized protein n=1 Tax=Collimonas arenae TaxID=279058 RepID=A0A127QJ72_9BURK|nr:hypothetical protein CAter10_2623 [Collimonas arenae]AMP10128.1 hypothetical protein CAter282_2382 [Collimonas arenae]